MIYVRDMHKFHPVSFNISQNDAYNFCAVVVESLDYCTLMISVYQAPWASLADVKDMCKSFDALTKKHNQIVITGDFNLSHLDASIKLCDFVCIFTNELNLSQIATSSTCEEAIRLNIHISTICRQQYYCATVNSRI